MVNNKNIYFPISSSSGAELKDFAEVEYPSEFKKVDFPYYYIVNSNIILFSGRTTSIFDGLGLWEFDKRTEEFTLLITNNGLYNYFYQVDGGVLISSSNLDVTYYFDEDTLTLTKVANISTVNLLSVAGGYLLSCYLNSSYSMHFFDSETKTLSDSLYSGQYDQVHRVDGGFLLYSTSSSYKGLVYYDEVEKTCTKVYETGYNFKHCMPITNGFVLSANQTSSYSGAVFFDITTKTCVQITSVGARYTVTTKIGDDYLISSAYFSGGIWHFDAETNIFTQVYPDGNWNQTKISDDYILFSSSVSDTLGILYYDKSTNTCTKIYDKGVNWFYIYPYYNYKYIVEFSNYMLLSQSKALLCFDKETKTITVLDEGTSFRLTDLGNACVACGSGSNYKVILIKYDDLSIETIKPSTTSNYYMCIETLETDTGVLFTGQMSSCNFYINKNTLEITNVTGYTGLMEYTPGLVFFDGSKYFITDSNNGYCFYFDETTLTITLLSSSRLAREYKEVDNGVIFATTRSIINGTGQGVYFYNKTDGTFARVHDGSNFLDYVIEYDGCLLLSSGFIGYSSSSTTIFPNTSNGILKYDPSDNSFTLIYSRGNGYKTLLPDGNTVRDNLDYNSLGYGCNLNTLKPNKLICGDVIGDYIYCDGYGIQKWSTGELYLLKDDYSMFTYDDLKEYGLETGETMLLYKKVGIQ